MLSPSRQITAKMKLLNMVYNLQYTDFQINIATSYYELRNYLNLADLTLVTGHDIQFREHKIELSYPGPKGAELWLGVFSDFILHYFYLCVRIYVCHKISPTVTSEIHS